LNHEGGKNLILVVHLPMLMRGHAIQTQVKDEFLKLRVPNLYKLELGLPVETEEDDACSFFDCKIRRLICVIPVRQPRFEEIVDDEAPAPEVEVFKATARVEKVEESLDDLMNLPEGSKIVEINPVPVSTSTAEEDDLLFDII
jgi:hypothetical protein